MCLLTHKKTLSQIGREFFCVLVWSYFSTDSFCFCIRSNIFFYDSIVIRIYKTTIFPKVLYFIPICPNSKLFKSLKSMKSPCRTIKRFERISIYGNLTNIFCGCYSSNRNFISISNKFPRSRRSSKTKLCRINRRKICRYS